MNGASREKTARAGALLIRGLVLMGLEMLNHLQRTYINNTVKELRLFLEDRSRIINNRAMRVKVISSMNKLIHKELAVLIRSAVLIFLEADTTEKFVLMEM